MAQAANTKAAEHHEMAAKTHRSAAEHHAKGDHTTGKDHAEKSLKHSTDAHGASVEADKKSKSSK